MADLFYDDKSECSIPDIRHLCYSRVTAPTVRKKVLVTKSDELVKRGQIWLSMINGYEYNVNKFNLINANFLFSNFASSLYNDRVILDVGNKGSIYKFNYQFNTNVVVPKCHVLDHNGAHGVVKLKSGDFSSITLNEKCLEILDKYASDGIVSERPRFDRTDRKMGYLQVGLKTFLWVPLTMNCEIGYVKFDTIESVQSNIFSYPPITKFNIFDQLSLRDQDIPKDPRLKNHLRLPLILMMYNRYLIDQGFFLGGKYIGKIFLVGGSPFGLNWQLLANSTANIYEIIDPSPSIIQPKVIDRSNLLILTVSGAGKSWAASKYKNSFVDIDNFVKWPEVNDSGDVWWKYYTNDQKKELYKNIADVIISKKGSKVMLFAYSDLLDIDYLRAHGVRVCSYIVSYEKLKSNLAARTKHGVVNQPGIDYLEKLWKENLMLTMFDFTTNLTDYLITVNVVYTKGKFKGVVRGALYLFDIRGNYTDHDSYITGVEMEQSNLDKFLFCEVDLFTASKFVPIGKYNFKAKFIIDTCQGLRDEGLLFKSEEIFTGEVNITEAYLDLSRLKLTYFDRIMWLNPVLVGLNSVSNSNNPNPHKSLNFINKVFMDWIVTYPIAISKRADKVKSFGRFSEFGQGIREDWCSVDCGIGYYYDASHLTLFSNSLIAGTPIAIHTNKLMLIDIGSVVGKTVGTKLRTECDVSLADYYDNREKLALIVCSQLGLVYGDPSGHMISQILSYVDPDVHIHFLKYAIKEGIIEHSTNELQSGFLIGLVFGYILDIPLTRRQRTTYSKYFNVESSITMELIHELVSSATFTKYTTF